MFSNDSDLRLTTGARASNVTFGVNGRLRIESGSIAEGLVLSESARVNFLVDGLTTLEGVMSTAGGDFSFEITGNQCMGLVVNAGSSLTVGDGCVADEIIVETNGTLNLLSGSTATNVVLGAGAKLYLPPDGKTTLSGKDSDGNDFSIDGKDVKGLTILPKRAFTLGDETATESDHWKGIGMTVREEGFLTVHAWSLLEDLRVESLGYRLGSVIL
ncbi:MAG: hypothetical protein GX561_07725 [Lentisphaerae bacterium]|jgi:type V secretory pathway adhesin AidA|nr:hypothetical protein [Lentisphaerota bacterium]